MADDTLSGIRWPRFLVEGAVIVVSILLAFFLEGWGAEREFQRDVTLELENVLVELKRNEEITRAEFEAVERTIVAIDTVIARLVAEPDAPYVAVRDSTAWLATYWAPTYDPSMGAIDALIGSGYLAQIEDNRLRLGLTGLRDLFRDATEESRIVLQMNIETLYPLVAESPDGPLLRAITGEILSVRQDAGRSPQEQVAESRMPTYRDVLLPNSRAMVGALSIKAGWYESALAEFRPLQSQIRELIEALETELAARR